MHTVEVTNIRKSFGPNLAVAEVSFAVEKGEIFGMLGPNGAGKTTSIRIMLDIFKPDRGHISVFGGDLNEQKKNNIGYLPEERGLYKDIKLEQVLIYLATLKGLDETTARRRLDKWLDRFDLTAHRRKKVQELSKGMQQKAQIIATLLHDPDLIVMDEPFAGLDPVNARLVKDILEDLRRAGKSIIMSTHRMYQVEALCNRIVLINEGHSVLYGQVDEIKHNFAGNAVVLEGKGDFSQLPGVIDDRRQNGEVHLTLAPGADPQAIFHTLAQRDNTSIDRFQIAEPSFEDIFIAVVQEGKEEPSYG